MFNYTQDMRPSDTDYHVSKILFNRIFIPSPTCPTSREKSCQNPFRLVLNFYHGPRGDTRTRDNKHHLIISDLLSLEDSSDTIEDQQW